MSRGAIRSSMADFAAASKETGCLVANHWYFTDMGDGSPDFVFTRYIVVTKGVR